MRRWRKNRQCYRLELDFRPVLRFFRLVFGFLTAGLLEK
jgi:hypothetical protein